MPRAQMLAPAGLATAEFPAPFLQDLPESSTRSLDRMTIEVSYPPEAVLFVEGQRSQGVMVMVSGRVKLSTTSSDGRTLILRIAGPGEVLGLSATIVARPYELTAETLEPCRVKIIRRDSFLQWLRSAPEMMLRIAEELAAEYNSTCQQLRSMLLSHTATQRLARMLLGLAGRSGACGCGEVRVHLSLTHQEMAEMIGSSRETVTRLLAMLRQKRVIEVNGATLVIRNPEALRQIGRGDGAVFGF